MTGNESTTWRSVCELTDPVMDALLSVERLLRVADLCELNQLEFRTLMWSRCALATLYGIRAEEALGEIALLDATVPGADLGTDPSSGPGIRLL